MTTQRWWPKKLLQSATATWSSLSSSGELCRPQVNFPPLLASGRWSTLYDHPAAAYLCRPAMIFFKAETNCKVGQVAALPARGKQWWSWHNGAFPPFLFSNSPCWNKLVVSLHLWQFCILEFCPKSCTFSIHLDVLLYGGWFQKEGFWKERQATWEEPIWWCLIV